MSGFKNVNVPATKSTAAAAELQPANQPDICCDKIREAAYFKWAAAGYPCNDGVEFWLEAESELKMAAAKTETVDK